MWQGMSWPRDMFFRLGVGGGELCTQPLPWAVRVLGPGYAIPTMGHILVGRSWATEALILNAVQGPARQNFPEP